MRCPKCGYISFDHNQICPKCNKDISDEQAKLNLPTFKNNPPSLLGMLVGAGDESSVGFTLDSDAALRNSGVGLDFEEASSMMESGELDFGEDDQDLEISLTDDTGEFELPEVGPDEESGDTGDMSDIDIDSEDEELSLDMDEVSFEDSEDTADDLDLGEVSMDEEDEEGDTAEDSMDGISPNDSIVLEEESGFSPEETEETLDINSVIKEDSEAPDEGLSTVELNVSDLKINETGELEISSIPDEITSPDKLPEEDEININENEIDIDSEEELELENDSGKPTDDQNETGSLEFSDLSLGSSGKLSLDEVGGADTAEIPVPEIKADEGDGTSSGDDEGLDLGDLAIEESEGSGDEDSMAMDLGAIADDEGLDLGELNIEEGSEEEEGFDLDGLSIDDNETGELQLSDIEGIKSEEAAPVDSEKTVGLSDSINIDLENLDLDLDLDDSKNEK